MKKVLFAAFAGICVISSIMATPAHPGTKKMDSQVMARQFMNDTVPGRKTDTSRYPKPTDTTSMPKMVQDIQ
jgi:hypothetical protein